MTTTYETRFWQKVDRRGPNQCWDWVSAIGANGYGSFWLNGRSVSAHRLSAMLTYGMFDRRLLVLHSCDRPRCVNPAHLRVGTYSDNARDMVKRGRHFCPGTAEQRVLQGRA